VSRAEGLEVPAHERGVLSGGLVVPAHARVGGFGFDDLHVVGWSVWLQQLGGVGSRMAVVLSVGGPRARKSGGLR
jgi:hypothetical protein